MVTSAQRLNNAFSTMLCLQRWNKYPRVETWLEAEASVFSAHVATFICAKEGVTPSVFASVLLRNLLLDLNKHYIADVPGEVRDYAETHSPETWQKVLIEASSSTLDMLPRKMRDRVAPFTRPNLMVSKHYIETEDVKKIESLYLSARTLSALAQIEANRKVYESEYGDVYQELVKKSEGCAYNHEFYETNRRYFDAIKRLKYLRRWNRINRNMPTSVMGHTYIVTIVAALCAFLEDEMTTDHKPLHDDPDKMLRVLLRALFHDVPESYTGDIITPVKTIFSKHDSGFIEKLESHHNEKFLGEVPGEMKQIINQYELLRELSDKQSNDFTDLVKDCDRMALLLECDYEIKNSASSNEIASAFGKYVDDLRLSNYSSIREMLRILVTN